jgi:hypothetical protein
MEPAMSYKWETELRELPEDDENDDVFSPDEEDFLDFCPCPVEACFGDWMSAFA